MDLWGDERAVFDRFGTANPDRCASHEGSKKKTAGGAGRDAGSPFLLAPVQAFRVLTNRKRSSDMTVNAPPAPNEIQ